MDWMNVCEGINLTNLFPVQCISSSAISSRRDAIRGFLKWPARSCVLHFRTSDKRKNLAKQKAEAQRRLYGQNPVRRLSPGSSDWEQQRHQLERRKEELVWALGLVSWLISLFWLVGWCIVNPCSNQVLSLWAIPQAGVSTLTTTYSFSHMT